MHRSLKILVLEHLFPMPPDSGGKIKSLCTIRSLASAHTVQVLSYVRTETEQEHVPKLKSICDNVDTVSFSRSRPADAACAVKSALLGKSYIVTRDFRREMLERFRQAVQKFQPDVVHVDHLQMAQFVDFDSSYLTVLDQHNVEHIIVKRISETSTNALLRAYARLEWPKLKKFERDACRRSNLVLAVSDQDAKELRNLMLPGAHRQENATVPPVETVPIGVDFDSIPLVERDPNSKDILFLGTMYWPPNIDCVLYFYREILPMIKQKLPECTFTIAGQKPPRAVQDLARDPAVRVTGYVKDPRDVAAKCGVFVVPLRSGSGVRVKILDALAMGLPVVSTSIGAEGLAVKNGEHLLIADDAESFAEAVTTILNNKEVAQNLGLRGRELVRQEYSWQVVEKRLLDVYESHLYKIRCSTK